LKLFCLKVREIPRVLLFLNRYTAALLGKSKLRTFDSTAAGRATWGFQYFNIGAACVLAPGAKPNNNGLTLGGRFFAADETFADR